MAKRSIGLGRVTRNLPKQVWSYKLDMFVTKGTKEYNRIIGKKTKK